MGEFKMPSLGADMDAGSIIEWRVHPGDTVHRGDIVAVVDTEKSDIEVETFEDGVIEELLVSPGVEVPVGTALARIRPAVGETLVATPELDATPSAGPAGRATNGPVAKRRGPRRRTTPRAATSSYAPLRWPDGKPQDRGSTLPASRDRGRAGPSRWPTSRARRLSLIHI